MFKSSDVSYRKPSNFNIISLILGIGYGFRFNYLFGLIKSLIKRTILVLVLDCVKDGDTHYELLDLSRTPSRTKRLT